MSAIVELSVLNVCKSFSTPGGELVILRDVSLQMSRGEAAVIMGPSGSGKSTLLNIIGTLERPSSGRVLLSTADPSSFSADEAARWRGRNVGFIFQDHHLLPQCTVLENVLIPTLPLKDRQDAGPRAKALLDRVGLSQRLDHLPAELSGGERQRVAVARALINGPTLLLADEPTGNLDRRAAGEVADLLVDVQRDQQVILLVVTHSASLAARFGACYELNDGRLELAAEHP